MSGCRDLYWQKSIVACRQGPEGNNFTAYLADDVAQAGRIILEEILPDLAATSVSWGCGRPAAALAPGFGFR